MKVLPLICPTCPSPLTFIAVLTDPGPISRILPHADEVAHQLPADDLDQTPDHDPAQPDPLPDDDFDQT